jgi:hypothetical protein
MFAPDDDGGHVRCTPAGCMHDAATGYVDVTSDGLAHAALADRIVVLARTGKPTIRARLPEDVRPFAFAVWNDVPTLVVSDADDRVRLVALGGGAP